jgi:hypothetical protein
MVEKVTVELGAAHDGARVTGNPASVNVHDAVSWEVSPVAVA